MTLAETLHPRALARVGGRSLAVLHVVAGSLVVAALAQLAIPLPWTPVPITGQTLGVLLVGAALGARRGAAALLLYLVEGAMGLPFFAGGAAGVGRLLGPTGGYLASFPVAALLVGWLAERGFDRRALSTAAALSLGTAVIFAGGVVRLASFVGWERVWVTGVAPFLAGAAIQIGVAAAALPLAWRWAGRPGRGREDSRS